jgi:uncharacterized protein
MRRDGDCIRFSASDLSNFLACRHLTRLDLAAASGLVDVPRLRDVGFDALVKRGEEHEQAILESYRGRGWEVREMPSPFENPELTAARTSEALSEGVDVIYQAVLGGDNRIGYPDFLVRADLLDGQDGYEVVDAKLARSAKARAVLQTTFYSALLAEQTGTPPRRMHLALGGGEMATFELADFAAYERQVGRMLNEFVQPPPAFPPADTYPEPTEHCAICRWRVHCMGKRRDDDDLSLIANITSRQRRVLKDAGITTRRGFASLAEPPDLEKVGKTGMARAHAQAVIQVQGEDSGEPRWELIEPERVDGELVPDRGLLVLPEPSDGDLFFDIEGARYYSEDGKEFGLQYLFGIVNAADIDADGTPRYTAFWAFDRSGEKEAFEELMDFLSEHMNRYPDAHIYHYNHYEPTSMEHLSELHTTREDVLRRLMGRFATREDEVDNLLRRRLFVDLYRVVRQGLRASVESYSIKRLEPFCGFTRAVPLEDVNERMVLFDMALDEGTARDDAVTRELIAGYNEDDCRATWALRDWLEDRRSDLARLLDQELPRPIPQEPPTDTIAPEIKALRAELLEGVPVELELRTPQQHARALMADLLEYYRREEKPAWWRYFHLLGLTDQELMDEPDAIAGLQFLKDAGPMKKSRLFEYGFPPQEFGFSSGDSAIDPITLVKWELYEVVEREGTLTIKRGPSKLELPHPTSLVAPGPEFMTTTHRQRIRELADVVKALGAADWPAGATLDLLLRRPPRLKDGATPELRTPRETGLDAGRRAALALDRSCLPIQGPPGTGKTFTGANQIVDLALAQKRVGITAMSHAVITNLMDEVAQVAAERGVTVRLGQRPGGDGQFVCQAAADADRLFKNTDEMATAFVDGEVDIVGGTTWVWTSERTASLLDVLVVDEAGQMSMPDVLASSHAARNLILLGDPLQLAFPGQGSHPPTVPGSSLEHILEDAATMPADRGLFLDETRRMHPSITVFTSEVFYDGRLSGIPGLERQSILGDGHLSGSGLRIVEVTHEGNSNASFEEALVVADIATTLLGVEWRDASDLVHPMTPEDIMVVTPFNAQIRQLYDVFREKGLTGIRVGTVDKFQGRQAPAVIYSMAASSAEDAPRGLEFLFDLRRLNVATSRAKALAIVVASPNLFRVFGKTPRQMQLVNALCRLREMAGST